MAAPAAAPADPATARPAVSSSCRRPVAIALAALTLVWLALSAALYVVMRQPPDAFGRVMAHTPLPLMIVLPFESLWKRARAGALHPGDLAPDFELPTLDHKARVRLSAFQGRQPVVLIFGSYT